MALKCNSCGGFLYYDIGRKKLKCQHCDSLFDVNSYHENNNAGVEQDTYSGYAVDVFTCKNCGAQLSAPTEQLVAYCNYCGSEAMELSKAEPADKPANIIPFAIGPGEVRAKFKEMVDKKFFVPAFFLEEENLKEFRGIYIPYFTTQVKMTSEPFKLKGTKDYTRGGYDYHEEYDITLQVKGGVDGGCYDASREFDDTVAAEIAPFQKKPVNFKEGYLAGYYADTVTADREKYSEMAREQAFERVTDKISKSLNNVKVSENEIRKNLEIENTQKSEVMLFPVWFLTWKNKDRVAYSVMNGETGKLSVDLPIDYGKFFKSAGIQAVIYMIIMSLLPIFHTPLRLASTFSLLLYLTAYMLNAELRRIKLQEQHIYDLGDDTHTFWRKKIPGKKGNYFITVMKILWISILVVFLGAVYSEGNTPGAVTTNLLLFGIVQLIPMCKSLYNLAGIGHKVGMINVIFATAVQWIGVVLSGPAEDYWYYIISLLLLIGMLSNILTAIYYTHFITTRPVPNFFDREGGRHE